MNRAAIGTGLLILCLAPLCSLAESVQMVPVPERTAVLPVLDCAKLVQHDFSGVAEAPTRVQSAAIEAATAERAEFCLVKGYVAPTIQFELRLPTTHWTGRYLQGGCGGNCGVIISGLAPRCDIQAAYRGDFAVGFENSGHTGGDGVWAPRGSAGTRGLRVSGGSRIFHRREGHHVGLLWSFTGLLVFSGMLRRWARGDDGDAAFSS